MITMKITSKERKILHLFWKKGTKKQTTDTYQTVTEKIQRWPKEIPVQKKKEKKEKKESKTKMIIIIGGKIEKTTKSKCKFHGEELLGPQASLRVTPCPPAPNHTRGEVIRPPSQIENNSYSVIRTRGLDDLSCTRCAPTITSRPSGICIIN